MALSRSFVCRHTSWREGGTSLLASPASAETEAWVGIRDDATTASVELGGFSSDGPARRILIDTDPGL